MRYAEYLAHLDLMAWAQKEVDRRYLEDRRKLAIDWSWEWKGMPTGGHAVESVDVDAIDARLAKWQGYEGDHTLGVE